MSDAKILEYIKADMDAKHLQLREDIKGLRADVNTMLAFKWQIIGGSVVFSVFASIAMKLMGF